MYLLDGIKIVVHVFSFFVKLVNFSFVTRDIPVVARFWVLHVPHGALVPVGTRPGFRAKLMVDVA